MRETSPDPFFLQFNNHNSLKFSVYYILCLKTLKCWFLHNVNNIWFEWLIILRFRIFCLIIKIVQFIRKLLHKFFLYFLNSYAADRRHLFVPLIFSLGNENPASFQSTVNNSTLTTTYKRQMYSCNSIIPLQRSRKKKDPVLLKLLFFSLSTVRIFCFCVHVITPCFLLVK